MEEAKKEIDKTKKAIFGVVAFLLCVFFFMLPLVQFTQNTVKGNMLLVSKGGSLDLGASGSNLSWEVSSTSDGSGPVNEDTVIAPSTTARNSLTLKVDRNETATTLFVTVTSTNGTVDTMPIKVVQITGTNLDSSRAASGWKMAIGGIIDGKTQEEKEEGFLIGLNINPNFLVLLLLIIPLALITLTLTNFSFTFLRNISILGPVAATAFIIMANKQYDYFMPTIFSWIILILYIGLFAFIQYCQVSEKIWKKNQVGA